MAERCELQITVVGAGILGLWQALSLQRAGLRVRLLERSPVPFEATASRFAGAMIAPYCEAESAPAVVRDLGLEAARQWRETYPGLVSNGSLVVAARRDQPDLVKFQRMTTGHELIDAERLGVLEPDLSGRFERALYFPSEAHMTTPQAMRALLDMARTAGVVCHFGVEWDGVVADGEIVVDCRGLDAREDIARLRGVRGERLIVRTGELRLSRTVRLLHPRHPLYIVPWSGGRFLVGATVIESEDRSAMTVRSALELLGLAYAVHPAFGEAEIIEMGAGLRPALPDNVPRVLVRRGGRHILVNGAYRHGFLLAPALAACVCQYLTTGRRDHPLLVMET